MALNSQTSILWSRLKCLQKGCPGYKVKLYLVVRFNFWNSGEYEVTHLFPLPPGSLWSRVIVPVWVSFMGQIDLFKIILKLFWTMVPLLNYPTFFMSHLIFTNLIKSVNQEIKGKHFLWIYLSTYKDFY